MNVEVVLWKPVGCAGFWMCVHLTVEGVDDKLVVCLAAAAELTNPMSAVLHGEHCCNHSVIWVPCAHLRHLLLRVHARRQMFTLIFEPLAHFCPDAHPRLQPLTSRALLLPHAYRHSLAPSTYTSALPHVLSLACTSTRTCPAPLISTSPIVSLFVFKQIQSVMIPT